MVDPIAQAYADCIHLPCTGCHAPPGNYCHNPITRRDRGTPCWARLHAADTEATKANTDDATSDTDTRP